MATQSGASVFARAYWMALGNLLLALLIVQIAGLPPWTVGWRDGALVAVVLSLVAVRFVDVTKLGGTDIYGSPATSAHVARYAASVAGVAVLAWIGAQSTTV
jgi:hypothetical protein